MTTQSPMTQNKNPLESKTLRYIDGELYMLVSEVMDNINMMISILENKEGEQDETLVKTTIL